MTSISATGSSGGAPCVQRIGPVRRSRPDAIGGYVMTSPARRTHSMLSVAAWCDTITNWGGCVTAGVRRSRLVRVGGTRDQPLLRTLLPVSVHSPAPSTGNPPLAGSGRVTARAGPLAAQEPSLCRELPSARSAPNEITKTRSVARCSGHGRGLRRTVTCTSPSPRVEPSAKWREAARCLFCAHRRPTRPLVVCASLHQAFTNIGERQHHLCLSVTSPYGSAATNIPTPSE